MRYGFNFRLATTEAGLATGRLFLRNIPPPSLCAYQDHSVKAAKGEGGQSYHGYERCTILWDVMSTSQSYALRQLIESALDSASGLLFATIDRSNGEAPGWDWIDVSGVPHIPDIAPGPVRGVRRGTSHHNIQLVLNNLSIVNDPAEF